MALAGKHTFGEIDGVRVTFVEKGISKERADFLKELLEVNNCEVVVNEDKRKSEEVPQLYTVAVKNMIFNPTIWVFQRILKTKDGRKVTQDYWNQKTEETNPHYWQFS